MALPLPPFFDPASASRVYRVPYQERAAQAQEWARARGIRPAAADLRRVALLLVDVQNTFCLPEFELFVAGRSGRGATDDCGRIAAFLYRNLDWITEVVVTLDTHTAAQIFHPLFWLDAEGGHPAPHTVITVADVESGRWRVNPALAQAVAPRAGFDVDAWARHYARRLAEGDKYPLVVWPYHSMVGGIGHALVSAVEEAVFFHSLARQSPTRVEVKGRNPLTENYSVLRPEVTEDRSGTPIDSPNRALVEHLLSFDTVVVAGEAQSHCVAWTVEDLLGEIRSRDERLAARVVLLDDCASPVVVPGVADFTDAAEAAYSRFAAAGMKRALSTDPAADWLGQRGP
ncbi:MAG TPA: isochorismatase [Vicinamibacteria bacterium]|nr:isochorismatase [Vicinamibacteria bacterium]